MKDHVNFLSSLRAKETFKNKARQGILVFGIILAGLVACRYAVLKFQMGRIGKENSRLETELNTLKNLQVLGVTLEGEKGELLEELEGYDEMLELRKRADRNGAWSATLTELASALPPGVWFDHLSVQGEGDEFFGGAILVRVVGRTFSQSELLHFLSRMEADPRWESATLHRVDRRTNERQDLPGLYHFELHLNLST